MMTHDVDGHAEEPGAGVAVRQVVVLPSPESGDEGLREEVIDGPRRSAPGQEAVHRRGMTLEEDSEAPGILQRSLDVLGVAPCVRTR